MAIANPVTVVVVLDIARPLSHIEEIIFGWAAASCSNLRVDGRSVVEAHLCTARRSYRVKLEKTCGFFWL